MARADLHLHSIYSERPSDWFMQKAGAAESYTDPQWLYKAAKEQGMTFVTLTDHQCIDGALLLQEKHPDDVFVGVETTTCFPEDGCQVDVLIYGLTADDFEDVQRLRGDVYDLRDFLKARDLAHAVAHLTYAVNGRLTVEHVEKLVLLFDVFEAINGGRNQTNNEVCRRLLMGLTPAVIEDLYRKHRIEPFSADPWVKGFTGGSDDHGGLFLGRTYTVAEGKTPAEFLACLKRRKSRAEGRHGDYRSLAFMVAKGVYDFSQAKGGKQSDATYTRLSALVFGTRPLQAEHRLKFKLFKAFRKQERRSFKQPLVELADRLEDKKRLTVEERLDLVYEKLTEVSDALAHTLFATLDQELDRGDVGGVVRNLTAMIPSLAIVLPFVVSMKHLSSNRPLIRELETRFGLERERRPRRTLWFTDSLMDMNGVAATLKTIGRLAHKRGLPLHIVTSLTDGEARQDLPPNVVNLPHVHSICLPAYESLRLKFPSLLRALRDLSEMNPEQIVISTPGPLGLLGLLLSRVLGIPAVGIYHTDFAAQAAEIVTSDSAVSLIQRYTRWFYAALDEIRVPTRAYREILSRQGFPVERLGIFRRGIDGQKFAPVASGRDFLRDQFGITDGFTLLYAGRISKDKQLDFLCEVYRGILRRQPDVNLLFVGEGPYLPELRNSLRGMRRVRFTGRLERELLPAVYSAADLLVFPSTTDTFGMVVLEAQACGLPAIVSDRGGPQEIIEDGLTGFVARAGQRADWEEKIMYVMDLASHNHQGFYEDMRLAARRRVVETYDWDVALVELFGGSAEKDAGAALSLRRCEPTPVRL